jgi:biotin transport system ATP-binding protein
MGETQRMGEPILRIKDLTHRFADGSLGLDRVNLIISKGEFVVISGRNGSGKTVLARHMNGLLEPTEGQVEVGGEPVAANPLRARQLVGLIFQDSDSQILGETVSEDVAFGPRNLRLDQDEIERRVQVSLRSVGMTGLEDRPPHLLSGGEKRCLAIAGVLAMGPRVLIFDEPFSNLDYPSTRQVLERIVGLHQEGHTIIAITHDLDRILAHADRLILMEEGRIARDGRPSEIIEDVELFGVRRLYPKGESPGSPVDIQALTWLRP